MSSVADTTLARGHHGQSKTTEGHYDAVVIEGEPYLRAGDAAQVLTEAGARAMTVAKLLHRLGRDGSVRRYPITAKMFLYHRGDIADAAARLSER